MDGDLADTEQHDDEYDETKDLETAKTATLQIIKGDVKSKPGGGFFKYTHNTEFDLTRYDIYSTTDITNYKQAYRHNCLYIALNNGGLGEDKLESMKRFVINRIVPQCKLKDLCKALDIVIKLSSIRKDKKT